MLLDLALAPFHGGTGIWDEVISWGVFIIVAAVVGLFFYQQWRERDDEDELDDEALLEAALPTETKDKDL